MPRLLSAALLGAALLSSPGGASGLVRSSQVAGWPRALLASIHRLAGCALTRRLPRAQGGRRALRVMAKPSPGGVPSSELAVPLPGPAPAASPSAAGALPPLARAACLCSRPRAHARSRRAGGRRNGQGHVSNGCYRRRCVPTPPHCIPAACGATHAAAATQPGPRR